jgi:ribonuclease HII
MDEVGRGALAGPVSVGVVVVDASVRTAPNGVRDSKLLTPAARRALVPRLKRWAVAHAVGHSEPEEIDRYGIIAALRLAGRRALAALPEPPGCVLLDGSHDWLSAPRPAPSRASRDAEGSVPLPQEESLFALDLVLPVPSRPAAPSVSLGCDPRVLTMVKADLRCAAVAAASVLAKVERDAIMVTRSEAFPHYEWQDNKGYSAPEHLAALAEHGPCEQHRRSWSLPGVIRAGLGEQTLIDVAALDDLAEAEVYEDAVLDLSDDDVEDAAYDPDDEPEGAAPRP